MIVGDAEAKRYVGFVETGGVHGNLWTFQSTDDWTEIDREDYQRNFPPYDWTIETRVPDPEPLVWDCEPGGRDCLIGRLPGQGLAVR